jgi:hypothetical protein
MTQLHLGYDLVPGAVSEFEVHKFTAFASDLGLRSGEWPETITTELGNKQPFVIESQQVADGDLQWVLYRQSCGCITLKVFND